MTSTAKDGLLAALHDARSRYLVQQCLFSQLQDMLNQDQAHSSSSTTAGQGMDDDTTQMLKQQPKLPAEAIASLAQHMQAAYLIQQLQLPAAATHEPGFSMFKAAHVGLDAAQDKGTVDQLGSKLHLMGVTAQHLRQQFLPSRKAAQKAHAPLLSHLERRLQQQAEVSVAAVMRAPHNEDQQGSTSSSSAGRGEAAAAAVTDKQRLLEQLHRANAAGLHELSNEALGYLGELDSIHRTLQQLVEGCMLQEQPKLDQVSRKNVEAQLQQLISKLQVMQVTIRADTYSSMNVAALAAVQQELQETEQQLLTHIEQVEGELSTYTELGEGFQDVVRDYSDTISRIRELDRVLQKFASIEDEAAVFFS